MCVCVLCCMLNVYSDNICLNIGYTLDAVRPPVLSDVCGSGGSHEPCHCWGWLVRPKCVSEICK